MAQTTYSNNPSRAYAGMVADGGFKDVISAINGSRQAYLITFTGATDDAVYTVTIGGTDYDTTYDDASPTAAEAQSAVVTTLADAVTDGFLSSVTEPSSTTILLIAANDQADLAVTIDSTTGDADWSISETVTFEASLPFGVFAVLDSDRGPGHCRLPNATGDIGNKTLGVSIQVTAQEPNNSEGHDHGEVVPLMNQGRIWVLAEETMAAGDNVFIRFTSGAGGSQLGVIRNDSDSSTCTQLTRARVMDYVLVGSDKLALVELS